MKISGQRQLLLCWSLFVSSALSASLAVSGQAITTRFWDCCKPSCAWKAKAAVNQPVLSCDINDKPTAATDGTACSTGGTAYQCTNQAPWAVNDTMAYGFAGIYLLPSLTGGHTEDAWCCACYRLDFTSDPLKGKSMIVQASNTAYDVTTANRFTLAMPGGNVTDTSACAQEWHVSQSVFGVPQNGVSSSADCSNLPMPLQQNCRFRFDWFKDAAYPAANFTRVTCPSELTSITNCTRDDEKQLAGSSSSTGSAAALLPSFPSISILIAVIVAGLLSMQ